MRKLFLFMMISLDGYFEGPEQDLSWHNVDAEFNAFAAAQLGEVDTLLFGRKTYDLMASYWPTEQGLHDDPVIAKLMNEKRKFVVSHNLTDPKWQNTKAITENVKNVISKMKAEDGQDIAIFGSNNLATTLIGEGLIDELRVMVSPIVITKGSAFLHELPSRLTLQLIATRPFANGNVLLTYRPKV